MNGAKIPVMPSLTRDAGPRHPLVRVEN